MTVKETKNGLLTVLVQFENRSTTVLTVEYFDMSFFC